MKQKLLFLLLVLLSATGVKADDLDYFTLTASGSWDVTVQLRPTVDEGEKIDNFLQYSSDKINWTTVSWDPYQYRAKQPRVTIHSGQSVYFRACEKRTTLKTQFYSTDGCLDASGNIMSLLDPTCSSTELGSNAFEKLFYQNRSLLHAKDLKLPALTLADSCYNMMFYGCYYLDDAPELPATTLAKDCYRAMFAGANYVTRVILGVTSITDGTPFNQWLSSTYPSTLLITKEMDEASKRILRRYTPRNWEIEAYDLDFFALTARDGDVNITLRYQDGTKIWEDWESAIEYSTDKINWNYTFRCPTDDLCLCELPTLESGHTYYFRRGKGSYLLKQIGNTASKGTLEASGNIMSLVDRSVSSTTVTSSMFNGLFSGCNALTSAENLVLPAMKLEPYCYGNLFFRCVNLTTPPQLPATELARGCYGNMFYHCDNLTVAPELPATELFFGCYGGMFQFCESLPVAPELPAKTLVADCYLNMFNGCNNVKMVKLGATDISAKECLFNWLYSTTDGVVYIEDELLEQLGTETSALCLPASWTPSQIYLTANQDPDNKGHYYATYYDSKHSWTVATDGAKAYAGELDESDASRISLTSLDGIPNDCGVVLHSTNSEMTAKSKIKLVYTEDEISSQGINNCLKGTDEEMLVPAPKDRSVYILSYGQEGLGFYKPKSTDRLAAHKAYLSLKGASPARSIRMVFDDDETAGVTGVDADEADTDIIYNLSGQRIGRLQAGINIVNGKKVLIK